MFDPNSCHDKICAAVGPLSKALNPTLLQGVCLLLSLINCKSLWIKASAKLHIIYIIYLLSEQLRVKGPIGAREFFVVIPGLGPPIEPCQGAGGLCHKRIKSQDLLLSLF